ncbi:M24 family metallopeptidase [Phycicoccus sp. CSK15P-2]|uniref:M24 family metallopeptidase n=1 Tax=Phycicoccus sp. CSK15P-2 TaxID=2807627 RepID=UPI001950F87A|nr:M24 family metallopeptidase [Phycicoccus sp. CSK15P-2]MBM6404870.1 M24 family metallopeptidase [Phycicoccus sp. CSK15P-2]
MADVTGFAGRLAALDDLARHAGVRRLVLREPAALTWLLGARVHVPQTLDAACLDVVVELGDPGTGPTAVVVTNAIEAPRLRDTELAGLPVEWAVVPWWEGRDARLPTGPDVGADRPRGDDVPLAADLAALRRVLDAQQQATLAQVCHDAASAATRAALALTPDDTEYRAAGRLADALLADGLDPVVLMVAGGDRGGRHRHPLPTGEPLGARAMLVCCARRDGLVASVTRWVSFAPLSAADRDAHTRLLRVEQRFLDASVPGARIGDVVSAGVAGYAAEGFDPDAWHRHHQGGFTGWQPREFPAHPGSDATVPRGSVLAWNPSTDRWKVEDTAVVRDDGPDLLVHDPEWPTVDVGGRPRPGVLVRA